MYSVRRIEIEEFFNSREQWNSLAASIPLPSIFCTWEWMRTWWDHFGKSYESVILFVYQDETLRGILPLAAKKTIMRDGWLLGNVLTYCSSIELYPDHLDLLAAPDDAEHCLNAIVQYLASSKKWDVCRISFTADGSNIHNWFMNNPTANRHGLHLSMKLISSASYIPLSKGFENYLQGFDKKEHYNLRSRNKKILQHGFAFHGSVPLQAANGIDDLLFLHDVRSAQKGLASTFSNPEIIRFHKAFATLIEKNDWLSLRYIGNDKENIAASYNFKYEGRVFSYQKGMAPKWERLGPGKAIVYEAIREAFEQGMKEYNFLQGNEEYKNSWAKDKRGLYNLTLYNRSVPARISRSMSTMTQAIKKLNRSIKWVRPH